MDEALKRLEQDGAVLADPAGDLVQVLEAVHLLLAFPMFVVFVAVDSRWLSSALIEELHALKTTSYPRSTVRRDTPTARDYLEKIFQLAFWVQPLSLSERSSIVAGLLAPVVRSGGDGAGTTEPGPELGRSEAEALQRMLDQSGRGLRLETSTLSLSRAEFEFVTSLGPLLGDTPRRVKRFVNTVQFLLSIQPSLESAGERPPRQSVALFAAIHQGLPTIGSAVFAPENAGLTLSQVLGSPSMSLPSPSREPSGSACSPTATWRTATISGGDSRSMATHPAGCAPKSAWRSRWRPRDSPTCWARREASRRARPRSRWSG